MKSTAPLFSRRQLTLRSSLMAFVLLLTLVSPLTQPGESSTPVEFGYKDFSYSTAGDATLTGEKPQSKLWWNDGIWWGVLWNNATVSYHIYRLDLVTQNWMDTGTTVDTRKVSRPDALWDDGSQKLYVVSNIFAFNSGQPAPAGERGKLFRYSYNPVTQSYNLDAGFPFEVTGGKSETLVVAKDSTGTLWVTYTESQRVMVNHSLNGDDLSWGTPFILPATDAANLTTDDICSVLSYNGRIGVMWSNQTTHKMYFAAHVDGTADTLWQGAAVYTLSADDHINLKTANVGAQGSIFAAIKTSRKAALIVLMTCLNGICTSPADWTSYTAYDGRYNTTRPIVLLDTENSDLYLFTRNEAGGPGTADAIYYKKTSMQNIQFDIPDLGTPFIRSATDINTNDPTSTKQNLTSATGLVVLAGDNAKKLYFHNYLALASSGLPVITSFTPASGGPGTLVTITGTHFTGTTAVKFNGIAATEFTVNSDTQVVATVPAGATSGKITLSIAADTAASPSDFTVDVAPTITSFTPASGASGTQVTLTGSGFTGTTAVSFNGTPATSFVVDSDTQIRAVSPGGATTGKISVTNPAGTALTATNFTVITMPAISSFAPASGAAGTQVVLTGSGFTGTTAVAFNGAAATTFTVDTGSQITATVPAGATTGKISVTNAAGTALSATNFTVNAAPVVTSFSPSSGVVGSSVTLTGSNFAGTTGVAFNGTAATTFTVNSDTQITATVPSGATTGKISVTNAQGTGQSAADFAVIVAPTITTFSPASGGVGTQVTVTGTGFTGTTVVRFNGTAATTFTVDSNTQVRANVPSGATSGTISVTNAAGTGVSPTSFTVTAAAGAMTFTAVADAQVKSSSPSTNYGTLTSLRIREGDAANPVTYNSYVRFNVTGQAGVVTSAKLRLFVTSASSQSAIVSVSPDTWAESTLTWNNRPLAGAVLGSSVPNVANTYVEIPLAASAFSAGNGSYSMVVSSSGALSAIFNSREAGVSPPELVLEAGAQASLMTDSPVQNARQDVVQPNEGVPGNGWVGRYSGRRPAMAQAWEVNAIVARREDETPERGERV